ncbi:MAG TPA: hypothetical protein VHY09_09510 [Candidatus Methylacidiphilales bacterium]|jgi:hypothetical protein|nr:hypothetical protein [Candidatus Methylacidiphilales bacterium]
MNRVSLAGLAVFIVPVALFAESGPIEKGDAFKTLIVSLSGLGMALLGTSYVLLVRRIERLRE